MIEKFDIAGYCRISVDEEQDRDNTSIENQKSIIAEYVKRHFPNATLTFYEDRDRSGYTFEQRENYQLMRRELMSHQKDILIVKDFSRFSRRNSRGLVELEDLRDAGARIISVGDNIDFPNDDDWLKIQFQFLINEMPVTDTSKKVRSVIKRRQADAKWICACPYGYIVNKAQQFELVPEQADIVRTIFKLYIGGWGYKKIANYLTDEGIPTPRMAERDRKEADGEEYKRQVRLEWSIITIQGILDNDFYIGTLRQGKYTRKRINGSNIKRETDDHLVFENHHQPTIDYRTFRTAKALREKRTSNAYRGVKINDNVYSGLLFCGDCGSPMFALSRSDLRDAYRCGTYHRRGLKGCSSHHIRVEKLDELLKIYLQKVQDNAEEMLKQLNDDLQNEVKDVNQTEHSADNLTEVLAELQQELKATKRQRIRDMMKHPEQEELLEETYDEMESDLTHRIEGLQHQISLTTDRRNTIIRVNRVAKTALEVFADIQAKPKLERADLELMVERINVYEERIEVQLQADIDAILRTGTLPEVSEEQSVNFKFDTENIEITVVQTAKSRKDKVFRVKVINNGDPLEIFTSNDGEVVFKKYSPVGEITRYASEYAEILHRAGGAPVLICDKDQVIAAAGIPKKEVLERRVSPSLEDAMKMRRVIDCNGATADRIKPIEGVERHALVCHPIMASSDVCGAVMFMSDADHHICDDVKRKLALTTANMLATQIEQ